ncbi:hypothetical protein ACE6H2_015826 [Prunus campanulata]
MLSKLGRHFIIGSLKEQNKACLIMGKHVCTNQGAVSRISGGLSTPAKGRTNWQSINGELQLIQGGDTYIHFIHYSHTHIQIHQKERRELAAKEGELGAVLGTTLLPPTSSSLLFILSMYFLFSVFIVMFN